MSVCLYPRNNINFSPRGPERFRVIKVINLTYYLSKSEFDKIIQHILIDFCNTTVLGYDKYNDKYWCKKYNKSRCTLHLEIKVISKGYEYSDIQIMPLTGEDDDINLFVSDFNESVQMYKSSNFIRSLLCKH
jgi:hypothetical protein